MVKKNRSCFCEQCGRTVLFCQHRPLEEPVVRRKCQHCEKVGKTVHYHKLFWLCFRCVAYGVVRNFFDNLYAQYLDHIEAGDFTGDGAMPPEATLDGLTHEEMLELYTKRAEQKQSLFANLGGLPRRPNDVRKR